MVVYTGERIESNPEEASDVPEQTKEQQPTTANDKQPSSVRDNSDRERDNLLMGHKRKNSECATCLKYTFCGVPMCCSYAILIVYLKCTGGRMC
jgi:hypothetical protein